MTRKIRAKPVTPRCYGKYSPRLPRRACDACHVSESCCAMTKSKPLCFGGHISTLLQCKKCRLAKDCRRQLKLTAKVTAGTRLTADADGMVRPAQSSDVVLGVALGDRAAKLPVVLSKHECMCVLGMENRLTLGKVYEGSVRDGFLVTTDDNGESDSFLLERFKQA